MNNVQITRAENGWRLTDTSGEGPPGEYVFEDSEDSFAAITSLKDALNTVIDIFGQSGSRHDKARLSVIIRPGDKYFDGKGSDKEKDEDKYEHKKFSE